MWYPSCRCGCRCRRKVLRDSVRWQIAQSKGKVIIRSKRNKKTGAWTVIATRTQPTSSEHGGIRCRIRALHWTELTPPIIVAAALFLLSTSCSYRCAMVPDSCAGVERFTNYELYTPLSLFHTNASRRQQLNNVKQNIAIEISKVNLKTIIIELSQQSLVRLLEKQFRKQLTNEFDKLNSISR